MKTRVKLKIDLTRYDTRLTEGSQGYAIGAQGAFSKMSDRFATVVFDNGVIFDVAWSTLEILQKQVDLNISTDIDSILRKLDRDSINQLSTATNVTLHVGPRGGFRYLSYYIGNNQYWTANRNSALEELALFKYLEIPYTKKLWIGK